MVKIISIIVGCAAIGFLIALISLMILLYDAATNQVAPLSYEVGVLFGALIFLICAMLSGIIGKVEEPMNL
jgi:Na+/proline symporter